MRKNTLYMLKFVWRADKRGVIIAAVSQLWLAFHMLVVTLMYKLLIDGVQNKSPLPYMLGIAIGFFAVTLISQYVVLGIGPKIDSRIEMRTEKVMLSVLLEKSARIDAEQYDDPEFYDMLTKAMTNAHTRALSVFGAVLSVFSNSINIAVNIGLMLLLSPVFIVISLVSVIVSYVTNIAFAKKKFQYNEVITLSGAERIILMDCSFSGNGNGYKAIYPVRRSFAREIHIRAYKETRNSNRAGYGTAKA